MDRTEFEKRIEALYSLNRYTEAAQVASQYVAAFPGESRPHALLAWVLIGSDDYKSAQGAASQACRLSPEWHWPKRLLAAVAFNQGEYSLAQQAIEECLRISPRTAEYHYFQSRIYGCSGERVKALAAASRAVELEPHNPDFLRAFHDREFGPQPSDLEILEQFRKLRGVLSLDPNHVATLADVARIHDTYLGDSEHAEHLLRKALAVEPDNRDLERKLQAIIRSRDAWFEALFLLLMPLFSLLLGLFVLLGGKSRSPWTFVAVVLLPCILCGIPATLLFLLPAAIYCGMTFSNDWISPNTNSTIGRWMRQAAESIWLRRLIAIPIAVAWWSLIAWFLPISPWWIVGGVIAGIAAAAWYHRRSMLRRRRRMRHLRTLFAPDTPGFDLLSASMSHDAR